MKYLAFVFTHSHLVPFLSPSRSLYFNMNPIVYIIDLLLASFHFDFAGVAMATVFLDWSKSMSVLVVTSVIKINKADFNQGN